VTYVADALQLARCVVCLSVRRLSVTYVLWLNGKSYGKIFTRLIGFVF